MSVSALHPVAAVHRACPLCHAPASESARTVLRRDGWRAISCDACGFVYMPEVPPAADLSEELAWEKQFEREGQRRRKQTPIIHRLEHATRWRHRILPRATPRRLIKGRIRSGKVLDVGCGTGSHSLEFLPEFTPHGVEISRGLAATANEAMNPHGGRCVHGPCNEALKEFDDAYFDVAVLRSYLEHEVHANDVLAQIHRILRPGGIAVVKVPNYGSVNRSVMGEKWCGFRLPDHVNYFTPDSLRTIGERHGFQVEMPWIWRLPTDDNMWAIFSKPSG
jgi:SAM-dependent methyltransferase